MHNNLVMDLELSPSATAYTNNATIISKQDINPELAIIQIRPDSGLVPEFSPGQYAEVALPELDIFETTKTGSKKLIRRSFSIASSPGQRDYLEFYVVHVPSGALTPSLWTLPVGSRVWLGPKIKGKFTMEEIPQGKDLVMVSTGTGLAPYISMLRTYRNQNRWNRFVVVHGARYSQDLGYSEELQQLSKDDSSVFYIPSVTREASGSTWSGARGRVTDILFSDVYKQHTGSLLTPEQCQVFLCGNPEMIDTAEKLLCDNGFQLHSKKNPGNIHLERYW